MKKLLFFLLVSNLYFGQITVYQNGFPQPNDYTVPITYHDYVDVAIKTQTFLRDVLFMTYDEDNSGYDVIGKDTVEIHRYIENGFGKNLGKLDLKLYSLGTKEGSVYKKAIIEGDFNLVLKFWAYYWPTNPQINKDASNLLVETNYIYDKIAFWKTKNGGKLIITNTAYDSEKFKQFARDYSAKKYTETPVKSVKIITPEPEPKLTASKNEQYEYKTIQFAKTKNGYSFKNEVIAELQEKIKQDFAKDKPGNYTAFYDVFSVNDVPDRIILKARLNR